MTSSFPFLSVCLYFYSIIHTSPPIVSSKSSASTFKKFQEIPHSPASDSVYQTLGGACQNDDLSPLSALTPFAQELVVTSLGCGCWPWNYLLLGYKT